MLRAVSHQNTLSAKTPRSCKRQRVEVPRKYSAFSCFVSAVKIAKVCEHGRDTQLRKTSRFWFDVFWSWGPQHRWFLIYVWNTNQQNRVFPGEGNLWATCDLCSVPGPPKATRCVKNSSTNNHTWTWITTIACNFGCTNRWSVLLFQVGFRGFGLLGGGAFKKYLALCVHWFCHRHCYILKLRSPKTSFTFLIESRGYWRWVEEHDVSEVRPDADLSRLFHRLWLRLPGKLHRRHSRSGAVCVLMV